MKRDFRRWSKADQNNDGFLTKGEFTDFLHPEESKHMKDVIVDVSVNLLMYAFIFWHCKQCRQHSLDLKLVALSTTLTNQISLYHFSLQRKIGGLLLIY